MKSSLKIIGAIIIMSSCFESLHAAQKICGTITTAEKGFFVSDNNDKTYKCMGGNSTGYETRPFDDHYQYVCATGDVYNGDPRQGYDYQFYNCIIDESSYGCTYTSFLSGGWCETCAPDSYGAQWVTHKNTNCDYCDYNYYYVSGYSGGCAECPDSGISDHQDLAFRPSITSCYMQEGDAFSDETGRGEYTGKCYWSL